MRFFIIRNRFIRNQGSARQKIKKLQGWIKGDLRNFQIEKNRKWSNDKKKNVIFAVIVYISGIINLLLYQLRCNEHLKTDFIHGKSINRGVKGTFIPIMS